MLLLAPLTPIVYIYIRSLFESAERAKRDLYPWISLGTFPPLCYQSEWSVSIRCGQNQVYGRRERERWKEERLIFIGAVAISRESALVTSRNTVGVLCSDPERIVTGKIRIFLCEKRTSCGRSQTIFQFLKPLEIIQQLFNSFQLTNPFSINLPIPVIPLFSSNFWEKSSFRNPPPSKRWRRMPVEKGWKHPGLLSGGSGRRVFPPITTRLIYNQERAVSAISQSGRYPRRPWICINPSENAKGAAKSKVGLCPTTQSQGREGQGIAPRATFYDRGRREEGGHERWFLQEASRTSRGRGIYGGPMVVEFLVLFMGRCTADDRLEICLFQSAGRSLHLVDSLQSNSALRGLRSLEGGGGGEGGRKEGRIARSLLPSIRARRGIPCIPGCWTLGVGRSWFRDVSERGVKATCFLCSSTIFQREKCWRISDL